MMTRQPFRFQLLNEGRGKALKIIQVESTERSDLCATTDRLKQLRAKQLPREVEPKLVEKEKRKRNRSVK